ncbi:aminotransferase class IV, partial [Mesorhizobium sp. M7A.F.Ca.CA.004.04.1.1]|uniref:aminotransferase class IV n=1 Tax=Mesorhizobium sp. M7A.F.Ca.CA.004.04.1.1 TaxID=2496733 RepID=UPI000FD34C22
RHWTSRLLLRCLRRRHQDRRAAAQCIGQAEGNVKEGGSSNAWIVTRDGVLVTRPAEHGILRGITRTTMFEVAAKLGLKIEERGFSVAEAKAAREAFISSATTLAMPVVAIDGDTVANGHPGSITLSLRQAFFDIAEKSPA